MNSEVADEFERAVESRRTRLIAWIAMAAIAAIVLAVIWK